MAWPTIRAAGRPPEARPVVDVVGHDGSVGTGRPHRGQRRLECRGREAGEDAAGVEPPDSEFTEETVPFDVLGHHRSRRRMGPVVHADRLTHAVAPFGEVERGAMLAADLVGRAPDDMVEVDTAL